jgi:hypothetical protein
MAERLKEGVKYDIGKLRYDLFPVLSEKEVVKVLTFGAAKYDDENWRLIDDLKRRYYAAARRHMEAWREGEINDTESSYHHLAHAICCLIFIMTTELEESQKQINN